MWSLSKFRDSLAAHPNAPPCMLAESTNGFSVIQRITATVSNCLPVAWTWTFINYTLLLGNKADLYSFDGQMDAQTVVKMGKLYGSII